MNKYQKRNATDPFGIHSKVPGDIQISDFSG
jgi:hypothetical protein